MIKRRLSYFLGFSPSQSFTRRCYAAGLMSLSCLVTTTCPVKTTESSASGHSAVCASSLTGVHSVACESGKAFCAIPYPDVKRAAAAKIQTVQQVPQFPLADTFKLHSRPTASKVIYLDFDGHDTIGTPWNSGGNTIKTAKYSFEGDGSFSNNELTQFQEVWQRVTECFAPFDVDVTTEEPPVADLINSGGSDTRWGIRVCIGTTTPSPAPGAGGVAYLGSFRWDTDTPTFVFIEGAGIVGKYVSDATVHEVGHTLGLSHDGRSTPSEGYYQGHGSGVTAWAPHMGVGYYVNLVQWSKGEYANANQSQDDLAIIVDPMDNGWGGTNGFGYRLDDAANSYTASAGIVGTVAGATFNVNQKGIIEKTTDVDWFKINAGAGSINLTAVGGPENTMLDIQLELYNASGTLLTTNNPVDGLTASISRTVAAGTYYVKVDGVSRTGPGTGTPPDEGYTEYSSLGQYRITGTYTGGGSVAGGNVVASYNGKTKTLTLTGDVSSNVVKVTFTPDAPMSVTGKILVEGLNGTKINNKAIVNNKSTIPLIAHTGKLNFGAVMSDGDDYLTVTGVDASQLYFNLGGGADTVALNLCKADKLNVDGGTGIDILLTPPGNTLPAVGSPNRIIKNVP